MSKNKSSRQIDSKGSANKVLSGKADHKIRNVYALAMALRNGSGYMHDKRQERGGAKVSLNRQNHD